MGVDVKRGYDRVGLYLAEKGEKVIAVSVEPSKKVLGQLREFIQVGGSSASGGYNTEDWVCAEAVS